MEILELLQSNTLPIIVLGCGVVGYILKEYIPLDSKHIPLIMAVLGIVFNIAINGYIGVAETIIAGAVSGLASTGLHQVFKQYFNDKKEVE
ncbi:holin [Erysipelothrix sp. HDW6A]|uniref:phage holin family protein n=1 Tax=Erysipelothrix sp. HDW6A TaxID=2714928 RepID=UPI00140B6AFC|nr:phage holin family protein [Erysipelothrix sp. HDW6A]QIK56677.1 holin [Erysipelothrix sp. HDW6A]